MGHDDILAQLEERLGHHFGNRELLRQAVTHRTWVEERTPGGHAPAHESQQRLEFLGDALLGYVVARWIYDQLPLAPEGTLTALRIEFTKGEWLAQKGAELGLDRFVRLGRGEAMNAANRRLLDDTAEAIVGAVLVDGGEDAAIRLVRSWLPRELPPPLPRDPIIAFGEWYQGRFKQSPPEPEYFSSGAQHGQVWRARREIDGIAYEGTGPNKQQANRALCSEIVAALEDADRAPRR